MPNTREETPFEAVSFGDDAPPARLGRFAVLRRLGSGGMGVVYAAYDDRLDRKVAIKVLHAEATEESTGRARLVREAQAMAKVSHPNVAHVYEVSQHEGRVYVVMQFIDGVDLRAWQEERSPAWSEVVQAYIQAARGLAAAHAAGLVHRDFKPSNVMIDKDAHVSVLDFGIARLQDELLPTPALDWAPSDLELDALRTRTGALVGTPAYLPPEVVRGGRADARSDQFSFCVSMFETVYGERPFGGATTAEVLLAMLEGRPPQRPEGNVPSWVHRVLVRGLSLDPAERFASMDALVEEIERNVRPRRGRVGLYMLAGVVCAGGIATAVRGNAETDPCPIDRGSMGEAWSEARRSDVELAFAGLSASFSDATWSRLDRRLEGYAQEWVDAMRDACEATRVRGVQSERMFDARSSCLADRRRSFDALTRVLSDVDVEMLEQTDDLLATLPPVRACDQPTTKVEPEAPPGSKETIAAILDGLARARALDSVGRREEASEIADTLIERADAVAYPPLQRAVTHGVGQLSRNATQYDRALSLFRRAYFDHVGAGDMDAASNVALDLAELHVQRAEPLAATEWARHAEAALASMTPEPPARRIDLLRARAGIARHAAKHEQAVGLLEGALEIAQDNDLSTHTLQSELAVVLSWMGKWGRAIELHDAEIADCGERLGSEHPECLRVEANLAFALLKKGDVEQARVRFDDLIARARSTFTGDLVGGIDAILNNAAGAYERVGLYDAAIGLFEEVHASRLERLGPGHPLTAHPLNNLGNVYASLERWDEAESNFSGALQILEEAQGPKHFHVSFPLHGLGLVARARGDHRAAVRHFARVAEIREAGDASPESRAGAWLELANERLKLAGQADAARAAALAAAEALAAAGSEEGEDLESLRGEVGRWLDAHPPL